MKQTLLGEFNIGMTHNSPYPYSAFKKDSQPGPSIPI